MQRAISLLNDKLDYLKKSFSSASKVVKETIEGTDEYRKLSNIRNQEDNKLGAASVLKEYLCGLKSAIELKQTEAEGYFQKSDMILRAFPKADLAFILQLEQELGLNNISTYIPFKSSRETESLRAASISNLYGVIHQNLIDSIKKHKVTPVSKPETSPPAPKKTPKITINKKESVAVEVPKEDPSSLRERFSSSLRYLNHTEEQLVRARKDGDQVLFDKFAEFKEALDDSLAYACDAIKINAISLDEAVDHILADVLSTVSNESILKIDEILRSKLKAHQDGLSKLNHQEALLFSKLVSNAIPNLVNATNENVQEALKTPALAFEFPDDNHDVSETLDEAEAEAELNLKADNLRKAKERFHAAFKSGNISSPRLFSISFLRMIGEDNYESSDFESFVKVCFENCDDFSLLRNFSKLNIEDSEDPEKEMLKILKQSSSKRLELLYESRLPSWEKKNMPDTQFKARVEQSIKYIDEAFEDGDLKKRESLKFISSSLDSLDLQDKLLKKLADKLSDESAKSKFLAAADSLSIEVLKMGELIERASDYPFNVDKNINSLIEIGSKYELMMIDLGERVLSL